MIPQEPLERLRKLAADTGVTRLDLDPLLDDLRVAAAFYTRLPVAQPTPVDGAALARAGWAAPLVGVLIGALGALAYWIAYRLNLPPLVAATLAVGATLLLTGCLHEDGLADTADGFGGGATRQQILDIMRDSRIGTYGALALGIALLLRIGALADLPNPGLVACALIAAHAAARASLPAFMWLIGPARSDGLSAAAGAPPGGRAAAAIAIGVVLLFVALGLRTGLTALVLLLACAAIMAWLCRRKIGGQTGDVLGALEQATECLVLLVAAARF